MKRTYLVASGLSLATALLTSLAHASPVYHPEGPNLVYGDVSNGYSILSTVTNPAAGAYDYKPGHGKIGFGIFSSIGGGAEVGDVNNIYNEIDAKSQEFQNMLDSFTVTGSAGDVTAAEQSVSSTINDTNSILSKVEQNGYAKGFTSLQWPAMPIQVTNDWLGGSLVFDVNTSLEARIGFLQDVINIDVSQLQNDITNAINTPNTDFVNGSDLTIRYDTTNGNNNVNFTVNNDSTVIVKASFIHELSMAYSRKVWNNAKGNLFAGLRGKYYRVELIHDFARIASNGDSQSQFDNISSEDRKKSSGIGLDFGTLWVTPNYHLGATLTNINEPSFDYNTIDISALSYSDATTINKLHPSETYTMQRQLKLEGALYTENKHWVIGAALDANAVKDPVGDKYQWAVVSAAYLSNHWWLPAVRIGYRSNNGDSKLHYITGGLTILKGLNIDLAYSPQKIEVDGSSTTRGAMINIGVEVSF